MTIWDPRELQINYGVQVSGDWFIGLFRSEKGGFSPLSHPKLSQIVMSPTGTHR